MNFNKILKKIKKNIQEVSEFTEAQIDQALGVYKDNQSDFVLFTNQISENPQESAKRLYEALKNKNFEEIQDLCLKDTSINFNLNKKLYFKEILETIHSKDIDFGKNSIGTDKNVVIDYSSPNIAKVFHVGHYRTTILGNFIKNLMKVSSFNVISLNYLGDWGKQFGLVLLGYEMFGNKEELNKDPLTHLFNVYVKINQEAEKNPLIHDQAKNIFKEMEENDNEKYMSLWRFFRELSIEKYKQIYKKLNIEFDVYSGESFYHKVAKNFAETTTLAIQDEDGSKYIDCTPFNKGLIMKNDGTTLYLTRDICAALDRIQKYNPYKLIYVVSSEQDLHLKQLFRCMELLGHDKNIFQHVGFGYVKGMSTRRGTVHFLEDIIESSADAIKTRLLNNEDIACEDQDATAYTLAISTLVVADFSAKRIKGYTFDFEQRANCEKGSGAYLQYAHCRLKSIEEMNSDYQITDTSKINFALIDIPEVHELCYKLIWYERTIELCLEDFEPSRLVLYLMDLCKIINNLIGKLRVKGESKEIAEARLLVLSSARKVVRNGLQVLGISPLNKM